jgi:hypothetical protein
MPSCQDGGGEEMNPYHDLQELFNLTMLGFSLVVLYKGHYIQQ